jgi:K+-sensing histidine kinase KdpD
MLPRIVDDVGEQYPAAEISLRAPTSCVALGSHAIDAALRECLENAVVHSDRATPSIEVTAHRRATEVVVQIADDGPGIPAMERRVLTDEAEMGALYHGSGMGLWLIAMIVQQSDGTLSFAENEPRGSVVTISLPREEP